MLKQRLCGALRAQWSMWDRIQSVRGEELHTLWRSFIVQALFGFTLNTIPVLVSVLTFGAYVLLGNRLTAAEAFTSLSLFTVRAHRLGAPFVTCKCIWSCRLQAFTRCCRRHRHILCAGWGKDRAWIEMD